MSNGRLTPSTELLRPRFAAVFLATIALGIAPLAPSASAQESSSELPPSADEATWSQLDEQLQRLADVARQAERLRFSTSFLSPAGAHQAARQCAQFCPTPSLCQTLCAGSPDLRELGQPASPQRSCA